MTPRCDPDPTPIGKPAETQGFRSRPPPPRGIVPIHPLARAAWPALRGVAYAQPGTVIVGFGGEVLRIREDGGAEEISAVPRRWSVAADPCAGRSTA